MDTIAEIAPPPQVPLVILDQDIKPDAILKTVQRERLHIVLTTEDLELKHKIALLNGLSKTAIDEKRVMVDDASVQAERETAAALVGILEVLDSRPAVEQQVNVISNFERVSLPPIELVQDETSTEQADLHYEE